MKKRPLPVDVRRSKTLLLKLPIISAHYPPQNCAVVRCLLYYCGLQIFFISFGKGRGLFTLLLLATPLFFLIQTYFHFRVIFTCLGAQQLPALIKRRCMEGPALKWTLSEVQLLRLRATFHTLRYFTYPRKFYTRKHVNISRRRKSTLRSIKLNRAISWTSPPPLPPATLSPAPRKG